MTIAMLNSRKKITDYFLSAAIVATLASCLVLPFATSMLSLFSTLLLIFWLLSGKFLDLPSLVKTEPVVSVSLLLLILFILGLSYSPTDLPDSLTVLKKYRELIFIPIVISLLKDNEAARKNCEHCFIVGCIILLLISYAMYFSFIPNARYGNSIVYHITHSFFMSLLAFWSAHKAIDSVQYRYCWIGIYLLTLFNLFYIATGRTGMLVFVVLMILFVMQRMSRLQQVIGVLLLTVLLSVAFYTSDNFSSRTRLALHEIQNYEYGASITSLGMRFDWWINSITLIKEKPVIGHGTGSFTAVHDKLIATTKIQPTDNPHNEYLLIGVQLGGVGLLVFIALFMVQLFRTHKLPKSEKMFAQGVVVAMITGCFMNSFLFDSHQGHFFALLSAVYFSSTPQDHLMLEA